MVTINSYFSGAGLLDIGLHKDGNKLNNSYENLELMTRSDHARLHATENNRLRKRDKRGRYK